MYAFKTGYEILLKPFTEFACQQGGNFHSRMRHISMLINKHPNRDAKWRNDGIESESLKVKVTTTRRTHRVYYTLKCSTSERRKKHR